VVNNTNEEGGILLQNNGFAPILHSWHMEIKLKKVPGTASLPYGIEIKPFIRDVHAVAVWQADNEAFLDLRGGHGQTFEEWSRESFGNSGYDPDLWVVAWDGEQVVGYSNNCFHKGMGWIRTLAIRHPWQLSDLGAALLDHSFGNFYKRDVKTVGAGVDSAIITTAVRFYQEAGMTAKGAFTMFEKEIGPKEDGKTFQYIPQS
jgi:hypothetical protein